MQFTTALIAIISFTAISAAPAKEPRDAVSTYAVQLANDRTGFNANANIPADNMTHNVFEYYNNTKLNTNGMIVATSAMLTNFTNNAYCSLKNSTSSTFLNSKQTWTRIDRNREELTEVNMNNFTIRCFEDRSMRRL